MLCSEMVRVSPAALAPGVAASKSNAANPMRRAARDVLSPVLCAPPASTNGRAVRGRLKTNACRRELWHRSDMANAVLSGRVNADFTPPPPQPPTRHPETSVWRKKAQEIQRLRPAFNSAGIGLGGP